MQGNREIAFVDTSDFLPFVFSLNIFCLSFAIKKLNYFLEFIEFLNLEQPF